MPLGRIPETPWSNIYYVISSYYVILHHVIGSLQIVDQVPEADVPTCALTGSPHGFRGPLIISLICISLFSLFHISSLINQANQNI